MKTRNLLNTLALLCVTLAITLSSCSRNNGELLRTIPENSSVIATLNVDGLMTAAGIKVKNGTLVLPANMQQLVNSQATQSQLDLIAKTGSCIDRETVAFFVYNDDTFLTFTITDPEGFEQGVLELAGNKESDSGYDIYSPGGGQTLLVKGNQGWIIDRHAASSIEVLDNALKDAKEKAVTENKTVTEALSRDGLANVAINYLAMNHPAASMGDAQWMTASVDSKGKSLKGVVNAVSKDGKTIDFKSMKKIDTDFLRYVPGNVVFAGALGVDPRFDWDKTAQQMLPLANYSTANTIGLIVPYLKSLDGTCAIAVWPKNDSFWNEPSPANAGILVTIALKKENSRDTFNQIKALFAQTGLQGRDNGGDTEVAYTLPGNMGNIFMSLRDNRLYVSTSPLEEQSNNIVGAFSGSRMSLYCAIPTLRAIDPRHAPVWGIKGSLKTDDTDITIEVEPTGTELTMIQAVIDAAIAQAR